MVRARWRPRGCCRDRRHAGFLPYPSCLLVIVARDATTPSSPTKPSSPRPVDRRWTNDVGTSRRRRPPIGLPSDTLFRLSVTAARPPGRNPRIPSPSLALLDAFQFRARGLINAANHPSTRATGVVWGDRGCKHTTVELLVVDVIVCVGTQTIAIRGTKPRGKSGMSSGGVCARSFSF